ANVADAERRSADDGNGEDRVEEPGEKELVGDPGDDAFLGKDELPGIDTDEIARPQRQHHRQIEDGLPAPAGIARRIVGNGKSDESGGERYGSRHQQAAPDDVEVGETEELGIGLKRELALDQT